MKRFMFALALLLAVSIPATALADPSANVMVWRPVKARTTLTSSTSPTFASLHGDAANTGIRSVDSLSFSVNAVGAGGNGAGGSDTLVIDLDDWAPGPWSMDGATAVADSVFGFVIAVSPTPGSALTAGADSLYFNLDASVDGVNWLALTTAVAHPHGVAEIGSTNSHAFAFFTTAAARIVATGSPSSAILNAPRVRVRVIGDASAANTGQYQAQIGYFQARTKNTGS